MADIVSVLFAGLEHPTCLSVDAAPNDPLYSTARITDVIPANIQVLLYVLVDRRRLRVHSLGDGVGVVVRIRYA